MMEEITITAEDAKLSPYKADPSKYLTDDKTIKWYLKYTLENGDLRDLEMALQDIAKAKGTSISNTNSIAKIFKRFGLKIELKTAS